MYNRDTELLFPSRVIPQLRNLRGKAWRDLVDSAVGSEQTGLDHLAFVLLMVRLDGCTTCHADSYRAMRGCTQCACQAVRRYRGSDNDLMAMYSQAQQDVQKYLDESEGSGPQA